MTKSARRKDSEQRSIELDLKMEVMVLKEKLMELQEDYDDLKTNFTSVLIGLDMGYCLPTDLVKAKLNELGVGR